MTLFKNEVVRIRDLCYSLVEYGSCSSYDFDIKGKKYCNLKSGFKCIVYKIDDIIPIAFKKYDSII